MTVAMARPANLRDILTKAALIPPQLKHQSSYRTDAYTPPVKLIKQNPQKNKHEANWFKLPIHREPFTIDRIYGYLSKFHKEYDK